nr:MAG TPA: hypothetical protein [Bacteriophage sp.]
MCLTGKTGIGRVLQQLTGKETQVQAFQKMEKVRCLTFGC